MTYTVCYVIDTGGQTLVCVMKRVVIFAISGNFLDTAAGVLFAGK